MPKKFRYIALLITLVMLASMVSISTLAQSPLSTEPGVDLPAGSGAAREEPDWQLSYHSGTQKVRFLNTKSGAPIRQPGLLPPNATPETAALNFLSHYGEIFGLDDPTNQLSVMKTRTLGDAAAGEVQRSFVRYQQVHAGIPVLGGELIVQMDANQDVLSVNGEVLPNLDLDTTPTVDSETARGTALAKIAKDYGLDVSELTASQPELWIYNPLLLGGPGPRFDTLVWRLDVESVDLLPIRELVLVDARLGVIALHFNQIDTAKQRQTYTANNTTTLPGTLVCNESDPSCSGGDEHAKKAHEFAGETYDFYANEHARDGIDDAGMTMISTVHYGTSYANAYWDGSQMVYGDAYGFPLADDVVAHELTHGVTDHESNLFYYYQSGAINESLSDIWGELVDQYGAISNDVGDTPWEIGEDITGLGAIRNMADPTLFGDPDKMTSPNYYCQQTDLYSGTGDSGGVHHNSGIGNKTAYLLTDGDSFNGKTVTGLGYAKVADLFYEVQTNLLTSAANYADLYDALLLACSNLGYSAGDCQEVKDAVDATEMNLQPTGCQATEAPICPSGLSPTNLFFDDIESGAGNWTIDSILGDPYWFVPQTSSIIGLAEPYATSGVGNIWGFDQGKGIFVSIGGKSDTFLAMNSDVSLPANAYLHFNHAFGFESDSVGTTFYDGGILEYSTDSGGSWSDAGSLFTHNGYNGTLQNGNPLGAVQAFGADSRGYISSHLDLSSLAGSNVRFRFRIGTDQLVYDYGWFIDDVRIYTCYGVNNPPNTPGSPNPADGSTNQSVNTTLSWTGGDPDGDSVTYDVYFAAGDATPDVLLCHDTSSLNCDPGALSYSTQYYWQIVSRDQHGATTQGPVWDFTTGAQPNNPPNTPGSPNPADGSTGQSVNTTLSWTGGDPDGDSVTYDVYFAAGDPTPNVLICDDTSNLNCDPGVLSYSTQYYWQIVSKDQHGATTPGPVWDFTTGAQPNNPPNTPGSPNPADGSTGQSVNTSLSWTGGDPDGDSVTYDVYFAAGDPTPNVLICDGTGSLSCDPGTLNYSTQYYWQVVSRDQHGATTPGPVWDFITGAQPNNPPNTPGNPNPADGSTGQSVNASLSWTGGDPDGDSVTYDVYFEAGDATPDVLFCDGTGSLNCDPGALNYSTQYFWQVVSRDQHGATTPGPVWNFTTGAQPNNPPNIPSSPNPADGSTSHSVNTSLYWTGGDPDGDSVTYDVYFEAGDATPDVLICDDTGSLNCDPGALNYSTQYYWQVVSKDQHGSTTPGPVWNFTTGAPPVQPDNKIFLPLAVKN